MDRGRILAAGEIALAGALAAIRPIPPLIPLVALAAASLWSRGRSLRDIGLRARALWHLPAGIALGLAAAAGIALAAPEGARLGLTPQVRGNPEHLLVAAVLAWTAAAGYEIVLRAWWLDRVERALGRAAPLAGAITGAAAFALALGEDSPFALAGAFAAGLGFALLYAGAGRTLALPIAVHGGFESGLLLLESLKLI